MKILSSLLFIFTLMSLAGCKVDKTYPSRSKDMYRFGSITGSQGANITGNLLETDADATGVNKYLWQGALKTLSFAPLATCDIKGGIIITDWYQLEGVPGESYKTSVHIKNKELRADALDVNIHKRTHTSHGNSAATQVAPEIQEKLENAILYQAKILRQKERNK